jgi:hypothetical protein
VLIRVELTVVLPEVIKDAFTTLNTALAPPTIEVELASKLTVVLPILMLLVLILTLAPTFKAVVKLAVAGSLAVFNVPEVIVVALAEMATALE